VVAVEVPAEEVAVYPQEAVLIYLPSHQAEHFVWKVGSVLLIQLASVDIKQEHAQILVIVIIKILIIQSQQKECFA
jgi:hypothetical protein